MLWSSQIGLKLKDTGLLFIVTTQAEEALVPLHLMFEEDLEEAFFRVFLSSEATIFTCWPELKLVKLGRITALTKEMMAIDTRISIKVNPFCLGIN